MTFEGIEKLLETKVFGVTLFTVGATVSVVPVVSLALGVGALSAIDSAAGVLVIT